MKTDVFYKGDVIGSYNEKTKQFIGNRLFSDLVLHHKTHNSDVDVMVNISSLKVGKSYNAYDVIPWKWNVPTDRTIIFWKAPDDTSKVRWKCYSKTTVLN